MKQTEWINGNKMKFVSGHKTFDRQIVAVTQGNVIGGGQYSTYIRPYNETICIGPPFPKGHLRKHDLDSFSGTFRLPSYLRKFIESITLDTKIIVYCFYHYDRKSDRSIVHGFVITDEKANLIKIHRTGQSYKSDLVLEEAAKYISNEKE